MYTSFYKRGPRAVLTRLETILTDVIDNFDAIENGRGWQASFKKTRAEPKLETLKVKNLTRTCVPDVGYPQRTPGSLLRLPAPFNGQKLEM